MSKTKSIHSTTSLSHDCSHFLQMCDSNMKICSNLQSDFPQGFFFVKFSCYIPFSQVEEWFHLFFSSNNALLGHNLLNEMKEEEKWQYLGNLCRQWPTDPVLPRIERPCCFSTSWHLRICLKKGQRNGEATQFPKRQ